MQTIEYWRQSKTWKDWLGKTGVVLGSTVVRVASTEMSSFTPYSLVLVEIDGVKKEFLGADHQAFVIGQQVRCVLRRLGSADERGIIPYGIKVSDID